MTIYYVQSNYIIADRYPNSDYNTLNDVVPLNGTTPPSDSNTSFVSNTSFKYDLSQLSYSSSFGYDQYINDKIAFRPIYILNNKIYKNNILL